MQGFFGGEWVGFKNFEFFFKSQDASRVIFNTLFMNTIFIVSLLVTSLLFAIVLSELRSKRCVKVYQSIMFFPYFLSWVIMGYVAFAFLSVDNGFINRVLTGLGMEPVQWYSVPNYWPFILTVINILKNVGYYCVIYYAAIMGLDQEIYEAADIDGATIPDKIFRITLPQLTSFISIMVLLQIGRIFYSDFGLFYYIPRETGVLFPRTDVIDTYVYRSLRVLGDQGMSSAVGLFQSFVGFLVVMTSNYITKKINPENALF